ncbi:hypothetical protein FRC03_003025 [Tulasnella sp. 419]|nr:hypothetical protein FRC03_003025 [Tulasnella sp. 419]
MKTWNGFVFHHRPAQHHLAAVEETVDNSLLDDFQEVESEIRHQASCTIGDDGLDDFSTVQPPLRSPPTAINDSRRPTSVAPATLPQSAPQSRIRNSSSCPEPRPTDREDGKRATPDEDVGEPQLDEPQLLHRPAKRARTDVPGEKPVPTTVSMKKRKGKPKPAPQKAPMTRSRRKSRA